MKKLQERLQDDIYKMADNFKDDNNSINFEDYRSTTNLIIDLASDQGIELDIPELLQKKLEEEDTNLLEIEKNSFEDNFKKMKSFNKRFSSMYDKVLPDLDFTQRYPRFENKMLQIDTLRLVDKFFSQYDKDISNYYVDMVCSNKLFFTKHILDYLNGITIDSIDNIDSYVLVVKRYTIFDSFTLAHETIHSYLSEKLRKMNRNEKVKYITNNIFEVYPHFIELALRDYLAKNNYNSNDLKRIKNEFNNSMIDDLASLNSFLNYTIYDLDSECDVDTFNENQGYSYGKVLAYHFLDQYNEEKDMAKENIYNFMINAKDNDLTYLLNNYGLNQKDLTSYKKLNKIIKLNN